MTIETTLMLGSSNGTLLFRTTGLERPVYTVVTYCDRIETPFFEVAERYFKEFMGTSIVENVRLDIENGFKFRNT
jgi:hypothetical protein